MLGPPVRTATSIVRVPDAGPAMTSASMPTAWTNDGGATRTSTAGSSPRSLMP